MQILQNLVQMTCQRDQLRLEFSVLSTFLQLPSIKNVRALELLKINGAYWVRPRTWVHGKTLVSTSEDFLNDPERFPLSDLPVLKDCLDRRVQHAQLITEDQAEHLLWLPVWMHEDVCACLEITQSEPFTPQSLDVITGIFNVYQNYQSLLDYSERDALTGLLNRKTFEEHLLRFASATQNQETHDPPWLAVIDIDHFKQVNDRFGHLFGDEVLILVANLLRAAFGSQYRVFRFGGEEFVVLLPSMNKNSALQVLETFRAMVQMHEFPQIDQVTVSIGFASAKLCSPVETLGQADQALYFAKENGRNSVYDYESLQEKGLLQLNTFSHNNIELF